MLLFWLKMQDFYCQILLDKGLVEVVSLHNLNDECWGKPKTT